MTKQFCDLCGKPAHDSAIGGEFPRGQPWRGYRSKDGGCEGSWQPRVRVDVGLRISDSKNGDGVPDLCGECISGLLADLMRKLTPAEPDNLTKVEAALEAERLEADRARHRSETRI